MFKIVRYATTDQERWETLLHESCAPSLLFHRDYVEYHKDRFEDYSLLIYDQKNKLWGALPGNASNSIWQSHGGLTYGGLIRRAGESLESIIEALAACLGFLKAAGFATVHYRPIPNCYFETMEESEHYAMFRLNGRLVRMDTNFVLDLRRPFLPQARRKRSYAKAKASNLTVRQDSAIDAFWKDILEPNLFQRFKAKPIHNVEEMTRLRRLLGDKIKLYSVYNEENFVLGGAVIYDSKFVAHAQYISANEIGKSVGALDFLFTELIQTIYTNKNFFSFGTANEDNGQKLNEGLAEWKESFGARPIAHCYYEIAL